MEVNRDSIVMQQLLESAQKQVRLLRIVAFTCVIMLLLAIAAGAVLIPRAMAALDELSAMSQKLASVDWAQISDKVNELITNVQPSLNEAAETLAGIDFDKLTKIDFSALTKIDFNALTTAIRDLQSVIAPLAKVFGGKA